MRTRESTEAEFAATARRWANNARTSAARLVEQQRKSEELAKQLASDRDLRPQAVKRRQAGLRAAVGLTAVDALQEAVDVLHTGSVELSRRIMPKPPTEHGEAVRARAEVEQILALPEHELAALLREDRQARATFFANATQRELAQARTNVVMNIDELYKQTLTEHAPQAAEAIADAQRAQEELLMVAGRCIAAGCHDVEMPAVGVPTVHRNVIDHSLRYRNLPAGWQAEQDGVLMADVSALRSLAERSSEGAA